MSAWLRIQGACAISVGQRHAEYNRTDFDEQVIDLTGQIKPA